jgi:hypothetical protein
MGLLDYMMLDEDEKRDFFASNETTQSPLIPQNLKTKAVVSVKNIQLVFGAHS